MNTLISRLRMVRRFRSPHHSCRESVMRTSGSKAALINKSSGVLSIPKFVNVPPQDGTIFGIWTLAAARLSPGRAVVVAMLLGPLAGALLAFGAVAAQEPNEVVIDNFTFGPNELTVAVGTTVKWVNHDDIPHNVINKDKVFRSKALDTDDSVFVYVRQCRHLRLLLRPASAHAGKDHRQVTAS